jgi:DNA-binding NtrC family response regulator
MHDFRPPPVVILADRDSASLEALSEQVVNWGYKAICAQDLTQLGQWLAASPADLIVMDLQFDGHDCLAILSRMLEHPACPPIVVLTGAGCIEEAVAAMRLGAYDYIAKPADHNRFQRIAAQAIRKHRLKRHMDGLSTTTAENDIAQTILGTSAAICRTRELISDFAVTDAKVLILGESGTGKELVARAIHQLSRRASRVFAPVNMAALPPSLAESVLFGHEKGAFTGADLLQRGWCEMADKGTLFLDEMGEMDLALQAKLLRFLQDSSFQRVGSSKVQTVDVRIIAATNRDPVNLVRDGRLREDLYYRLNVLPIVVPPLRDRREDIMLLAQVFLERASKSHQKRVKEFTPAALDVLTSYDWPGNVRQLENTVERLVILCRNGSIGVHDLPPEILGGSPFPGPCLDAATLPAETASVRCEMRDIERGAILNALSQSGGNVVRAASILGLGQATVYRKLKRYGIRVERKQRQEIDEIGTHVPVVIDTER